MKLGKGCLASRDPQFLPQSTPTLHQFLLQHPPTPVGITFRIRLKAWIDIRNPAIRKNLYKVIVEAQFLGPLEQNSCHQRRIFKTTFALYTTITQHVFSNCLSSHFKRWLRQPSIVHKTHSSNRQTRSPHQSLQRRPKLSRHRHCNIHISTLSEGQCYSMLRYGRRGRPNWRTCPGICHWR